MNILQSFNATNLEARFIKNILANTYIPTIHIADKDDYMVAGCLYLLGNDVVRCTRSGKRSAAICSKKTICSDTLFCSRSQINPTYSHIEPYSDRRLLHGINDRFLSSSSRYDSDTHTYLGQYLRMYKSLHGIDLMPLYNCFNDDKTELFSIDNDSLEIIDYRSKNDNVWLVPIKFNKKYTIYSDAQSVVKIKSCFVDRSGRVRQQDYPLDDRLREKAIPVFGMQFSNPYVYEIRCEEFSLMSMEPNLKLIIQIDKRHTGSIVVLEGDYSERPTNVINSSEFIKSVNYDKFVPNVIPSLSVIGTGSNKPYSDRLIEYLLQNVVDSEDDINYNVLRIQQALGLENKKYITKDVWTDYLRSSLYCAHNRRTNRLLFDKNELDREHRPLNTNKFVFDSDKDKLLTVGDNIVGTKNINLVRENGSYIYDILGYLDKDVEKTISMNRGV